MTSNRDWLMRLAHDAYNAQDELATWMGAEHETNGIADGTNGIADGITLADCDAVAILRDLRGCVNVPMLKDTLCRETGTHDLVSALETLADMVERDYVRREAYDYAHREFNRMNEERREAFAERDEWHEKAAELEIELAQVRGNLKNATHNYAIARAKCESREQEALRRERMADDKMAEAERAIAEPPEERTRELIAKLEAERDGWRMRCGELLDAAHAMQSVADAWDEEVEL